MNGPLSSAAHATDRGRRPTNQDAVCAVRLADGRALVAVADGMGGHAGGEVASAAAVRALEGTLAAGATLASAMDAANRAIVRRAHADRTLQGMGTTLVALLQNARSYQIANVGDSRAYRVFADRIEQITSDHSFVTEAVRSGQMSAEDALRSPWRHALTRSLGVEEGVCVDLFGPFRVDDFAPHVVVLCSDGVHKACEDRDIQAIVAAAPSTEAAARGLVAEALQAGSDDNVSVAIRDFGFFKPRVRAPGGPGGSVAPTARGLGAPLLAPAPRKEGARVPAPPPMVFAARDPREIGVRPPRSRSRPRLSSRGLQRNLHDRMLLAACVGTLLLWIATFFLDL